MEYLHDSAARLRVQRPFATRLKTRHLVLLVHLDASRSILRAAAAAGMSQPAASKMLAEIESALEVELFVRHARGVEPTEYGTLVVRHARNALTEIGQAQDEVAALRSGLAGDVAIGTVITSATHLVPLAVARLKQRYPRIVVSIDVDFSELLIERLTAGRLDLVIARIHNLPHVAELAYEGLVENPHGVFARAGHPLARRRRVALADLAREAWVLPPPGNVLRDRLSVVFSEQGLALPQQDVETASLPVITSLLRMSDMVSVLADEVVEPEVRAGHLAKLRIELPIRLGAAGIVTRRDHALSPAAQTLLTVLRETAKVAGAARDRR
jgi:DNA-binding transcriptional LysR family regulator